MTILISLLNHTAFKGAVSQKYKQYSCKRKKQSYITFKLMNKEEFQVFGPYYVIGKMLSHKCNLVLILYSSSLSREGVTERLNEKILLRN